MVVFYCVNLAKLELYFLEFSLLTALSKNWPIFAQDLESRGEATVIVFLPLKVGERPGAAGIFLINDTHCHGSFFWYVAALESTAPLDLARSSLSESRNKNMYSPLHRVPVSRADHPREQLYTMRDKHRFQFVLTGSCFLISVFLAPVYVQLLTPAFSLVDP